MPSLTKVCPECCTSVNVKRTACDCGHSFALRPKVSVNTTRKSKRIAMKRKRSLESLCETMSRLERVRTYTASKRALESPSERMARRQQDRTYTASKRALESPSESMARREQDRMYTASKRALESPSESMARREQDRTYSAKTKALESPRQHMARREQNKTYTASKRALESPSESMARREQDRTYSAKKKALESPSQRMARREQNKTYTASKRALESPSESMARREQDRTYSAKKKALESPSQRMARREQNKTYTASKRALESPSERMARREQHRTYSAKKKALESPSQRMARREQERIYAAKKRAMNISIDNAIATFYSKAKMGPDYVCTICHRLMYKQTVVPCNKSKYTKASNDLLEQVFCADYSYTSSDGRQWLCRTCDSSLLRGKMPVQAKANNLQLDPIPEELSTLNALELRLISLRVPFMKMVALPCGKQRSIQGPAVNVPSKLDSLCNVLPRLPTESELIALKLKRKLKYKGHYMYDYVSPEKHINALRWLKANNHLYANVEINLNWVDQALANDCDLFGSLVRQPDCENSSPEHVPQGHAQDNSASHNDSMECESSSTATTTNAKPCESSSLNNPTNQLTTATNTLTALARQRGFSVHDVPGDGNCLFNAIAYQLQSVSAREMRETVAKHLESNSVFYSNFLAQPVASNNAYNADTEAPNDEDANIDTIANPQQQMLLRWQKYIRRFRNGAWGDHITVQGISNEFHVAVNVLSSEHSNVIRVVPRYCGNIEHEVNIGLIMQYHYVGLDKLATPNNVASSLIILPQTVLMTH